MRTLPTAGSCSLPCSVAIPEGALQNVVRLAEVTLRQFQLGRRPPDHRAKRDVIVAGGSAQSPPALA